MADKDKLKYSELIMNVCLDYQSEKISWDFFVQNLEWITTIMKKNEA